MGKLGEDKTWNALTKVGGDNIESVIFKNCDNRLD